MAKISSKKLMKRIKALKTYRDFNTDDPFDNGYVRAADTIVYFIEEMQAKAEKKRKQKKVPVIKLQDTIVTDLCPNCGAKMERE